VLACAAVSRQVVRRSAWLCVCAAPWYVCSWGATYHMYQRPAQASYTNNVHTAATRAGPSAEHMV
jgi:hypothetical protein